MTATTNKAARTLLLHNAGISTSGDTEQFIEINGVRYSHIVNPATGLGLTQRIQATIIGPNATTTDSLDTTVSVLGVKRGLALIESLPRTAALIVTKEDGQTHTLRFAPFPADSPGALKEVRSRAHLGTTTTLSCVFPSPRLRGEGKGEGFVN